MTAQDIFTLAARIQNLFAELKVLNIVYVSCTQNTLLLGLSNRGTCVPAELKVIFKRKQVDDQKKYYLRVMSDSGKPVEEAAGPAVSLLLSEVFLKINEE